jgi:Kef-type K+ transport system membrane component KefB
MNTASLSLIFFLQMLVILGACRAVGWLARLVGQPQVIGEMIAGVLLGPSLLGWLWPTGQAAIFPPESRLILQVVAQLGIGLYMFLVGMEFDTALLRRQLRSAVVVSFSGMLVPFALGVALAPWLSGMPGLFGDKVVVRDAALFLGAAMAITAFPMLARILRERGQTGSMVGTLALAAGAVEDAAAWGVLAVVLANFGGGMTSAFLTIGGGVAFVVIALTLGRPPLARLGRAVEHAGRLTPELLAVTLMCLMASVWITEAIGLHAVMGGFVLGVAMPRGRLTGELQRLLEPFTTVFLLPVFFTYSGINTRFDLMLGSLPLLGVAAVVLGAACLGKFGACWAAARLTGTDNRLALALGALMNARGMMELILLNIGLERGIIQPSLFSILVLMTVVTTVLAAPLFGRFHPGPSMDRRN